MTTSFISYYCYILTDHIQHFVLNNAYLICILLSFSSTDCVLFQLLIMSRSLTVDFIFIFSFHFILFLFLFLFYFLCLEQLGLGFISHTVTSVTSWWHSHKTDHETWKNEVEGSGIKWRHTTWTVRVGYTVVSMDHE